MTDFSSGKVQGTRRLSNIICALRPWSLPVAPPCPATNVKDNFCFYFATHLQVSLMPSILPLLLLLRMDVARDYAATAAAIALIVTFHLMSNVANTLFDFKTGAIPSRRLPPPPRLHPTLEQVSTQLNKQTIV